MRNSTWAFLGRSGSLPAVTVFTALLLIGGLASAQTNTYDNSTINTLFAYFGNTNTATYGQSFTAPQNFLNSWTFYLSNNGTDNQDFRFYVMPFNGSFTTGPVLWQSGLQTITTADNTYTAFTVTPDLSLTAGSNYVMFINESGMNPGTTGQIIAGGVTNNFLGGKFVWQNNGDDFSLLSSQIWQDYGVPRSMAAQATFSTVVPEPSTLVLAGLGLAGMLAIRRRCK